MDNNDWIGDSLVGFLECPLWTEPIATFIDNNCIVFDAEEEHKLEYTMIHVKYKEMIEWMLENFLADLDISPDVFLDLLKDKFDIEENVRDSMLTATKMISAAGDYLLFRNIMTERNLVLEADVLEQAQKNLKENGISEYSEIAPQPNENQMNEMNENEMLELALKLSAEEAEKAKNNNNRISTEEEQLALAIESSRIEFEKLKVQQQQQEQATKMALEMSLKLSTTSKKAGKKKETPKPKMKKTATPKLQSLKPLKTMKPLPSFTNSLKAAQTAGWISDAAKESTVKMRLASTSTESPSNTTTPPPTSTPTTPSTHVVTPTEADARMNYWSSVRAKMKKKTNDERTAKIEAIAKEAPPPTETETAATQPKRRNKGSLTGITLTQSLAQRLKEDTSRRK